MKKTISFLFFLTFIFLSASGQVLEKAIDSLVSSQIKITDPGIALVKTSCCSVGAISR